MKFTFNFHFKMRWANLYFLLLHLIPILESVHYVKKHDLYPFSELLNSGIDNNTDPCNDFYQYACGKWNENNEIPDTFDTWDSHDMTKLSTEIMMKEVLENPNIDESNKKLYVEKKIYNACMDEGYSREEGGRVLEGILLETPSQRWQDVAEYYVIKFSAFDLFHISLNEDKHLQIERPRFSKSNEKLFKDIENEIKFGVNWLYQSVHNSYVNKTLSYHVVNESLRFVKAVNQITFRSQEDIQTISILELQVLYDNHCPSKYAKIEWLQFFQRLVEGSYNFTMYDELIVDIKYVTDLCKVLSRTPKYAIVTYLQYNIVFNNDTVALTKIDINKKSYTERYLYCIKTLKITEGTTKEILDLHVPSTSRKIVHEMFKGIISAIIKEIENSWLVNDLKQCIVSKIKEITYRYGIVDDYFEDKLGIEGVYEFEVGRVAFQNELNLKRAQIINILQVHKEAHGVRSRAKRSSSCNACYILDKNEFLIGVGMMFSPYFYENAPIGFNYGRLGFTMGHEISHSFDIDHLHCLISGIHSEHEKKEMESMLEKRKNCFVDEFNNLDPPVGGLRTLDENIADTQGIKRAWKAMNAAIRNKETEDEGQPNFEHWNQMKLFFLSFANQWCSNPEYREDTGVDTHAPHVIRTLETLKNMNEFAETYDCTSGETMNPLMKCDLWANSSKTDSQYIFKKLKKYFT